MSADDEIKIPPEAITYLNEIAERLWSGHAAVMIGAGFSKNARKATTAAQDFPDWHKLGDNFHELLYGKMPDENLHYLNPLKLASEVEAAFGRPALDQLLRTSIPDKLYEPSDLHVSLLELPWADVFTANYDTLLERASKKVTSRRFDVVVNKEDLVYSSRPRIIKLHGSFPSTRPFIITEEDYRQYPKEYASFVNTVQQSLIENTLCLIGFSGDDPNFLHWIGWVRDNLGTSNAPRMYLVGLPSLTVAQKRLLEQRNIVIVDLAQSSGVKGNHGKAFSLFFEYILQRKPVTFLEWPRQCHRITDASQCKTIEALIQIWRVQRETYPNWIVAPESSLESLLIPLRMANYGLNHLSTTEQIAPPLDLEFLFELNWQLERSLSTIHTGHIQHYERVIDRYNPFPNQIPFDSPQISPTHHQYSNLNWKILTVKWLDLSLSLLRFYREEAMVEKWEGVNKRLEKVEDRLSADQVARWHYERCLNALFHFDFSEIRKELSVWPINITLPFWEAKRAGLLAELGDVSEAEGILEGSLSTIRSNQQLAPVVSDFTWASQESHVMYLLSSVKMARLIAERKQLQEEGSRQQFHERWNELKKYECDPWNDLTLFGIKLKAPVNVKKAVSRKKDFDIGREVVSRSFGGGENESYLGYSFLRYCEEAGLPFAVLSLNIAPLSAQKAAEQIGKYSPEWALVTLLRIGDKKQVGSFFGRENIAAMNVAQVDEYVDRLIGVLQRAQPAISQGDRFLSKNLAVRIGHAIPEILSRLCTKCSYSRIDAMLILLKQLYDSPARANYDGVPHLLERLLWSLPENRQMEKMAQLFNFQLRDHGIAPEEVGYPEPFRFVNVSHKIASKVGNISVDAKTTENLLAIVASQNGTERYRACLRCKELYYLGLLDETQSAEFGKAIWGQKGQDGFPVHTPFYKATLISLPAPSNIDPQGLFKAYVKGFSFAEVDEANGSSIKVEQTGKFGKVSINITGGRIIFCEEIFRATKTPGGSGSIDWSQEESIDLLNRVINWWDSGKHWLRETEIPSFIYNIPEEFRARFQNLVPILAFIVAPRLTEDIPSEAKESLKRLLNDLDTYGQPSLLAHAACLKIFSCAVDSVLARIEKALATSDHDQAVDALNAVLVLSRTDSINAKDVFHRLLSAVGQQIKWRSEVALVNSMYVMGEVIEKSPHLFSEELESVVLFGLEFLVKESNVLLDSPIQEIADRLSYRQIAASLACTLFKYYTISKLAPNSVVLGWRKICSDPEEFAEIRKQWDA